MPTLETTARNAGIDAITALFDVGGAGDLIFETSGDVEVATCALSATSFGAAASGTCTAAAISDDTSATGGVTVAQASIKDGAALKQIEFTVATSGQDIDISSTSVGAGDTVSVSSLTVTQPA